MVGINGSAPATTCGESRTEELIKAASTGNTSLVLSLIEKGCPVNARDECGRSALHWASFRNHSETIAGLLYSGAKVNLPDNCGYTALQRAACEGHVEIVRQLIKSNANVDHQDDQHGNTALHEAAWKGYSQTAEALVKAKTNVYVRNKGGFAPLHLACQNGHNQTCRVLLLAGCKPDIKNNYGDTPLHTSARYGHAGVSRILLSAHSNVKETNKNGDTALHIATAMGRRKLTRILLESSADQSIKNKQSEAPRDIAIRKEFSQILEILNNPPPVITQEERLRREQEQKKREAEEGKKGKGKNDKKREKTNNGSGTSSKDSSSRPNEKKKLKPDPKDKKKKEKNVGWSPYGCHYYSPVAEFPLPNLDSLPKEPLDAGEQYFLDLAGNIKKGPIGKSYTCYCAPFFKTMEHKLEKDKVDLMEHIDAAHDKLDAKITCLEKKTKSHIQYLSETVKQKLAMEKEECRQRVERFHQIRDSNYEEDIREVKRIADHKGLRRSPSLREKMFLRSIAKKSRDYNAIGYPLTRSKSEEAISETNFDCQEPVYKGLRVLDHPTSMYNIPQTFDDSVLYDSLKNSAMDLIIPDKQIGHRSRHSESLGISGSDAINRHREVLGLDAKEGESKPGEPPLVSDVLSTPFCSDLTQAVDNLKVSTQSQINHQSLQYDDKKSPKCVTDWTPQDFRKNNPYMYDLRDFNFVDFPPGMTQLQYPYVYDVYPENGAMTLDLAKRGVEFYHANYVQTEADFEGNTYLDMDRYRLQQAVRKLYDGYLAEGKLDHRLRTKLVMESSAELDPHNDSGYSTRMCTASQGPSPSLSGGGQEGSDLEIRGLQVDPSHLAVSDCRPAHSEDLVCSNVNNTNLEYPTPVREIFHPVALGLPPRVPRLPPSQNNHVVFSALTVGESSLV